MCVNGDDIFGLEAGELFTCRIHEQGVRELQALLVAANSPPKTGLAAWLPSLFGRRAR